MPLPADAPYRMLGIDMDRTLLSPDGQVTPRTRAAVRAAVLAQIGHYDAAVFVGGAMVVDTANHTVLHRTIMRSQLAVVSAAD